MPVTAIVLPVSQLDRRNRRRASRMTALAHACVRWLDYGWRTLASTKFLRLAACSIAFAATVAGANASGPASPVGASFRVNQVTGAPQQNAACAMDADGDYVVVWESRAYNYFGRDIIVRRFNAAGVAQGGDVRIGMGTFFQSNPDVAMDAAGNFTVVWAQGDGRGNGIFGQRFDAAGMRLGHEFRINEKTSLEQFAPAIAMEADGDFVVAWDSAVAETPYSSYSGYDGVGIAARRFDADGNPKGGEFLVNGSLFNNQTQPDVAVDADGDFVVVWMSAYHDGDYWGIVGQRFDADGATVGDEFQVNQSFAGNQQLARVAMDAAGDFVVAWQSYYLSDSTNPLNSTTYSLWHNSVLVRRYDASGPAGDEQVVERGDVFDDNDRNQAPAIAMDADGDFAVAWERQLPGQHTIRVQVYRPDGVVEGPSLVVNSAVYYQYAPDIAISAGGNFVVARHGNGPGDSDGIFGRQYKVTDDNTPPVVAGVYLPGDASHVLEGERLTSRPASLVVTLSQPMDPGVEDPGLWALTRDGGDVSGMIDDVAFGFNSASRRYEAVLTFTGPLADGEYMLTLHDFAISASGLQLDGDGNGSEGGDFSRSFIVAAPVPLGGDVQSNTAVASYYDAGCAVAMDADDNYVIVWQDNGGFAFNNTDLMLRRYDANGAPLSAPININQTNDDNFSLWELEPAIAMDADGDFVVVWTQGPLSITSALSHVAAQRFDAAGNPVGSLITAPFLAWSSPQRHPAVAMDSDGSFIVAWSQPVSGQYDVYATRFDENGNDLGSWRVHNASSADQIEPDIAFDATGCFVIAWTDQQGAASQIRARRYDRFGNPGDEFDVTTFAGAGVTKPAIALDAVGNLAVAWEGLPPGPRAVYMSRFDANDNLLSSTLVSEGSSDAHNPDIAVDADGDVVVTWHHDGDNSYSALNAADDVYARRYNAVGEPADDGFIVNLATSTAEQSPAIAMDDDGDFILAWLAPYNVANTNVFHRRFAANQAPTVGPIAPVVVNEDAADSFLDFDALAVFNDSTDGASLAYSVSSNDNPSLVAATFSGAVLQLAYAPDENGVAIIIVRATDSGGKWAEGTLNVTVNAVNDAPVLTPDTPQLTDVLEDATNPPGNTVAEIIGTTVSDVDDGAQQGIAIISAVANAPSEGRWQYFTTELGVWTNFPAVSEGAALLLRAADKVRFLPVAGFVGTRTITYHAWDRTSGAPGPGGDVTGGTGGVTAFSAATDTAGVSVNSINDAPTLDNTGTPALSDVDEDNGAPVGDPVSTIIGASITDPDPGALKGIAIIGADAVNGLWQFSLDGGINWTDLPAVSNSAALQLRDTDLIRYIPNPGFNGSADISYRAWDRTTGIAGESVSLAGGGTTGGSTAFSTETETATVTVTPVNDAPVLDTTGTPRLGTISNNNSNPAGTPVTTLIGAAITDPDTDALEGVAVVDITGAGNGVWQYSIDGVTFHNFPDVSEAAALLLRDTDLIRFAPHTNFVGAATVTFRAWDQTSGSAGSTADLSAVGAVGGTTAFSLAIETAGVDVTAQGEDDKGNNCAAVSGTGAPALGLLALLVAVLAALRAMVVSRRPD